MNATKVRTELVTVAAACARLLISRRTFDRTWADIFSDNRDPADRHKGCHRKVREDELLVAINDGRLAVLAYRRSVGRTR